MTYWLKTSHYICTASSTDCRGCEGFRKKVDLSGHSVGCAFRVDGCCLFGAAIEVARVAEKENQIMQLSCHMTDLCLQLSNANRKIKDLNAEVEKAKTPPIKKNCRAAQGNQSGKGTNEKQRK